MTKQVRSKAEILLDLVARGVPVNTAYGAAEMTTAEFKAWQATGENKEQLEIARKKAEARIVLDTLQLGKSDWRCLQSTLERINPAEYGKPEVQVALRQTDNDAKQIGLNILKFLAVAEERHSGDAEVIKDAVVSGGDVVPQAPKNQHLLDVEIENPYDEGDDDDQGV